MKHWMLAAVALASAACPPSPSPPAPDASDASLVGDGVITGCGVMCANLAAIGCIEGVDARCVEACEKNQAAPVAVLPVACIAHATTKEAARGCGGVRCP